VGRSRRGIPAPHNYDRSRIRRCPICQWAIDQDHAEALAMAVAERAQSGAPAPSPAPPGRSDEEELVAAGFALV
jgi:hypothetical protein